ncbi:MAG: RNA polymerase sigma factor [Oscillospiraceae bacterium]|nr:RNA polymerase sigma factor [Oscillospiraceae bacterium]
MPIPLQRTGRAIQDVFQEHSQAVYRVAYSYMKNPQDSEDAVQESFLRLIRAGLTFPDSRQERAWLIVTASNVCRDMLKAKSRQHLNIDDQLDLAAPDHEPNNVLDAILALPDKYKSAVYFYYYEGYSVNEIARMLRLPPNTVKTRLSRARKALKLTLGGETDD